MSEREIMISGTPIRAGLPAYVIAEIGVNHDGDMTTARRLIDAAAEAGVQAVKFQYFRAEMLLSRAARLAGYQRRAGERDPAEMLRRLELDEDQLAALAEHAHGAGLHAIVTVFSTGLVEGARAIPFDAFKSASPDVINRPLLDAMACDGRALLVSTGAATLDEVLRAWEWLSYARGRVGFMQCVSVYPTPPECASLGAIGALAGVLPTPIGYSDHTVDTSTGQAAVMVGAAFLEKHLTLDKSAPGPDHAASLTPAEMRRYVELARAARPCGPDKIAGCLSDDPRLGSRDKVVLDVERDVRVVARQSITATRDMAAGDCLTPADLTIKRPGTGIEPFRMDWVLSRRTARDIPADTPITESDLVSEDSCLKPIQAGSRPSKA